MRERVQLRILVQRLAGALAVVLMTIVPHGEAGATQFKILHPFCGKRCHEGSSAYGGIIMDASGNIYGSTEEGGTNNLGTVYEFSEIGGTWTLETLYSFCAKG